jgi:twitching motility protein PilT
MVGEMRDLETISLAITAAETGHLVMGTLHTGNASRTLDRLLDVFPPDQQAQVRIMVSESLRGVISSWFRASMAIRAYSRWKFLPTLRPSPM